MAIYLAFVRKCCQESKEFNSAGLSSTLDFLSLQRVGPRVSNSTNEDQPSTARATSSRPEREVSYLINMQGGWSVVDSEGVEEVTGLSLMSCVTLTEPLPCTKRQFSDPEDKISYSSLNFTGLE